MKAQQLKNAILQLAIQGKLVPQDPNDEPASVLLEKIQAEKAKLIAEGKIKKSRKTSDKHPCVVDEFPFEIPESWVWVTLGTIGDWGAGSTPNRHEPKFYDNGNIPWLKTGDLNDGYITSVPEYITDFALEKNSLKINPVGSVLIAMYGATIGKLGILNIEATTNQACCACQVYNGIDNKYLFYYLMSQKRSLQKKSEGSGQPNISREKIVNYIFPLPPLNEQKRIVAKLEEILPFIEEYDKKEQKLTALNQQFPEQLKKSILQAAIQGKLVEQDPNDEPASELIKRIQAEKERLISEKKIKKPKIKSEIILRDNLPYEIVDGVERCIADEVPFEIPESWAWVRLENYCNNHDSQRKPVSVEYRKHQKKIYDYYGATGVIDKVEEYLFDGRYVLIGEDGGNFFVNRDNAFIAEGKFWANNHVHVLSTLFELEKYFCFFLNALNLPAMGVINGIAVPKLNQKNLNNILIAVPPLNEQKLIVQKIEELFSYIKHL